ncbi:hypothetical protein COSO111634_18200 [Corallococcus soli]
MWKGTPVIGGNVGGIRHQIQDGHNGFLVDTVAARRGVLLSERQTCILSPRSAVERGVRRPSPAR